MTRIAPSCRSITRLSPAGSRLLLAARLRRNLASPATRIGSRSPWPGGVTRLGPRAAQRIARGGGRFYPRIVCLACLISAARRQHFSTTSRRAGGAGHPAARPSATRCAHRVPVYADGPTDTCRRGDGARGDGPQETRASKSARAAPSAMARLYERALGPVRTGARRESPAGGAVEPSAADRRAKRPLQILYSRRISESTGAGAALQTRSSASISPTPATRFVPSRPSW
jgi:hypothetical protein